MAWYYGVNNSELYGSNFSTVLADAPPPLDDTIDEDDNEIVFRNDISKSKISCEKANASAVKTEHSSDDFDEESKVDACVPNGRTSRKLEEEGSSQVEIEIEDDFGDFSNFADFSSAFGQDGNTGEETKGWFTNEENRANSFHAENANGSQGKQRDSDLEYADFAAFQENSSNPNNQENIHNDLRYSGNDWMKNNAFKDKSILSNGCHNMDIDDDDAGDDDDDDDDFGDFTSVNDTQRSHEGNVSADKSNSTRHQPNLELSLTSQETEEVHTSSQGNANQCNGDLPDQISVTHSGEHEGSESFKEPLSDVNEEECSSVSHTIQSATLQVISSDKLPSSPGKDQESRLSSNMSATITQDEYQSSISSLTHRKEAKPIGNNRERDEKNSILSCDNGKEESAGENQDDKRRINSSTHECSAGSKMLPGNGFEEFANFDDHQLKEAPGDFGSLNSNPVDCQKDDNTDCLAEDITNNDDSFGDFGSFESNAKDSERIGNDPHSNNSDTKDSQKDSSDDFSGFESTATKLQRNNSTNDFGNFGSFEAKNNRSNGLESQENTDNFGDFGAFESNGKDSDRGDVNNFGGFDSNAVEANEDVDSVEDFRSFKTKGNSKGSLKCNSNNTDNFGDFGAFESKAEDSVKSDGNDDDFGDFGSFESNAKQSGQEPQSHVFGDLGAFKSQATDSQRKGKDDDDDFRDFGAFESQEKSAASSVKFSEMQNKDKNHPGDLRTSKSPEFNESMPTSNLNSWNISSEQTGENIHVSDFSVRGDKKNDGFHVASSPREKVALKEQGAGIVSHFQPGHGLVIKQAGDAVSACFTSEQRDASDSFHTDVLSTKVDKGFHSNMGLWQHLEKSEKEGRIIFNWSNSFSQHKKFLSLSIRPERPPPLQAGSMLKPIVSSQLPSLTGGHAASVLLPVPSSQLPHFSSGLGFLEPVKATTQETQAQNNQPQNKVNLQDSSHADVPLPDLSFILGNGLNRTSSKSDVKDNVSETASESSSLDLDFFAPSTTQTSDGKSDSRALYEDLLGLNILSASVELQKEDIPKPQKVAPTDRKNVWQHGGVTIPLSQQNRAELSPAAKNMLGQLEDLTFMTSSVLMFPLKSD